MKTVQIRDDAHLRLQKALLAARERGDGEGKTMADAVEAAVDCWLKAGGRFGAAAAVLEGTEKKKTGGKKDGHSGVARFSGRVAVVAGVAADGPQAPAGGDQGLTEGPADQVQQHGGDGEAQPGGTQAGRGEAGSDDGREAPLPAEAAPEGLDTAGSDPAEVSPRLVRRFVKTFQGKTYTAQDDEAGELRLIEGSNDWDGWLVERYPAPGARNTWKLTDGFDQINLPGVEKDESYEVEDV